MNIFAKRLRWLREQRNLTQKEMAELVGVSQQYYNKFEKGTGQPNLKTLYKIRKVFDESLDFLIGFHFEDSKALELYDDYVNARQEREDAEYYLETFKNDLKQDTDAQEFIVNLYKEQVSVVRKASLKEEEYFNTFYDYILKIPGCTGTISTKEFWIERYDKLDQEIINLSTDFDEDLEESVDK